MKRFIMCSRLVIPALLLAGCGIYIEGPSGLSVVRGSGNVITETRNVSGFDKLSLSGLGDVSISQGQTESLTIEAEDNIIPEIKTEVRDGTLHIGFKRDKPDTVIPTKAIRFNLAVKNLVEVRTSGAGNMQMPDLKTDRLAIHLSGAGSCKVERLEAGSVSTNITGAGNVELAGKVTQQDVRLSGLGSYRAGDLASQSASISVSGAGSTTVWVTGSLNVTISGAGSVNYYGSPTVSKTITGVGAVKSLGTK